MFCKEKITETLRDFLRDKRGATSIEYALFAALIGIVLVMALGQVYNAMDRTFGSISTSTEQVNTENDQRQEVVQ